MKPAMFVINVDMVLKKKLQIKAGQKITRIIAMVLDQLKQLKINQHHIELDKEIQMDVKIGKDIFGRSFNYLTGGLVKGRNILKAKASMFQ